MKKIYEVRPEGPSRFFSFLESVAQKQSWPWEFHHIDAMTDQVYAEADAVLVDMALSASLLQHSPMQPTLVSNLQSLDSFFKDDGKWLPRNLFYESLRRVLISEARDLDIRQPAFVVGRGEKMRLLGSLLSEIGVKDIFLISLDEEDLAEEMRFLRQRQLGVRFSHIPAEQLTMQVVSAGIIANSEILEEGSSLLSDLSYFNYMKMAGYVLDVSFTEEKNPLLEEAVNAELKPLPTILILKNFVDLWMERLEITATPMKVEELKEHWILFLKENSSSV